MLMARVARAELWPLAVRVSLSLRLTGVANRRGGRLVPCPSHLGCPPRAWWVRGGRRAVPSARARTRSLPSRSP